MGSTEKSEASGMAKCTDGVGSIKFLESASRMCDELKLNRVVLSVSGGKRAVLTVSVSSAPNKRDLDQPHWASVSMLTKSGYSR